MRIGIYTNRLEKRGYGRFGNQMYEKLMEHGFSCTDFSMSDTDSILYTMPWAEAEKYLIEEKSIAEDAGIEIWQVHGPWKWPPVDSTPGGREERLDKMKRSISMTAVLGCKYWVIHPIMPFGIHDKGSGNEMETWKLNMEFMSKLLAHAQKNGVTICLENMPMPGFSLGTPEEILKFVKAVDDPDFKICLDVGHVAVYDELNIGEEIRRLGNEIRTLHVHDAKLNVDAHLIPYQGMTDWKAFSQSLKDIGFEGVFSLETRPPVDFPTPIFEKMSKLYVEIAREIING